MSQLARVSIAITPNDSADLPRPIIKLYVGTGGTLKFELAKDDGLSAPTITVVAGQIIDIGIIRKVHSTGTSASGLIGFA